EARQAQPVDVPLSGHERRGALVGQQGMVFDERTGHGPSSSRTAGPRGGTTGSALPVGGSAAAGADRRSPRRVGGLAGRAAYRAVPLTPRPVEKCGLTADVRALIGAPAHKRLRSRQAGPEHWRGDGVPTGGSGASAGSGVRSRVRDGWVLAGDELCQVL